MIKTLKNTKKTTLALIFACIAGFLIIAACNFIPMFTAHAETSAAAENAGAGMPGSTENAEIANVTYFFYDTNKPDSKERSGYKNVDYTSFSTKAVYTDDSIVVKANNYPSQLNLDSSNKSFGVFLEYGSAFADKVDITNYASYSPETGCVTIDRSVVKDDDYVTVVFYLGKH